MAPAYGESCQQCELRTLPFLAPLTSSYGVFSAGVSLGCHQLEYLTCTSLEAALPLIAVGRATVGADVAAALVEGAGISGDHGNGFLCLDQTTTTKKEAQPKQVALFWEGANDNVVQLCQARDCRQLDLASGIDSFYANCMQGWTD